ncbi:MAG TPA: bacitracin ABC transporter ATP-binding protein, partial [Cyanobacteria bacterium UBA11049]|nr:bacitracin ABC transporter ATP-binding protein [Cyanobacteria bacterium UBA11049]
MTKSNVTTNSYETDISQTRFLEIENLVKSYPTPDGSEFVVLDGIDLNVGEDEFIAVIGHSGCGKSTLLKMVAGLEKPTAGSVR